MSEPRAVHHSGSPDGWELLVCRAVGEQLRRAREHKGWNRTRAAAHLSAAISPRTLADIEHGDRAVAVPQYVELCQVLDADPGETVNTALAHIADLTAVTLLVNLTGIARDRTDGFGQVQRWARTRLHHYPHDTELLLRGPAVKELAVAFNQPYVKLANYLIDFSVHDGN